MASNLKMFTDRSVFFLGWLLSPLTFWNDAFVNIPLSYLCARLVYKLTQRVDLLPMVLGFYWISNLLGILLMYLAGKSIFSIKANVIRETVKIIATVAGYSLLLVAIHRFWPLRQ